MQANIALPRTPGTSLLNEWLTRATVSMGGWLIPSIADILFLGCLLVALRAGGMMLSADGDPARHLVVGEHILASGAIPRTDVFSHTMGGHDFVPYEWLAEVTSAASYRLAGLAGPVLVHGAMIGLTFALLYCQLRRRGQTLLLSLAVTLLAASASSIHWLARPHVITFAGTAIFCFVLDGWHNGTLRRRWLWSLAPAMVLWANAHGGFLIGFILIGAYAGANLLRLLFGGSDAVALAGKRMRDLAFPAFGVFASTLLTPAGTGLLGHVTGYFGKKLLVNRTIEYMSPDFHSPDALLFLAMLLLSIAGLAWSRRRPTLEEGLLLLGFSYFALHSARNIPLFAIVVAPMLAGQLSGVPMVIEAGERTHRLATIMGNWLRQRNAAYTRMDARARGHLWPVVALALLGALASAQYRQGDAPLGQQFNPRRQPVAAAAYLKENPPAGNGLNELVWGGFLLHELWPQHRVFIDGQTDFYGEALTQEYLDAVELSPGWRDVLARHDIRWVIYPTDSVFTRQLSQEPGWRTVFQDKVATVLVKGQA